MFSFFVACFRQIVRGNLQYWIWIAILSVIIGNGLVFYSQQLDRGLVVTGLSDQISWGSYIANFTFLVGVAAAAVMLVIPAYIFHRDDIKHMVLIGEGIAVAAVIMCMAFVVVDMGRPDRILHMLPFIGRFNFPASLLAWDVVVLAGYLFLNLTIPFYILFEKYRDREPNPKIYLPGVFIAIGWAISIHTVTAFLFSSNAGRPFWHTAVLGPRFLASAFAAGPALIVLALQIIDRVTDFKVERRVIDFLAMIITVALQINLFLLGVELFTEFYTGEHNTSAVFLYFGLQGYDALVPWIWSAMGLNLTAVVILTIHPLRRHRGFLNVALVLTVIGVWIEKGMGLIIPGFIPTPIGEVFEYSPTAVEVFVSLGIWAFGLLMFTLLVKIAIPIELDQLKHPRPRLPGEGYRA